MLLQSALQKLSQAGVEAFVFWKLGLIDMQVPDRSAQESLYQVTNENFVPELAATCDDANYLEELPSTLLANMVRWLAPSRPGARNGSKEID